MKAYKPKHNKWRFSYESKYYFGRFFPYRRLNLTSLDSLTQLVWFFWFIVFALRVGIIFPFIFFNELGMNITAASNNIHLPLAEHYTISEMSSMHFTTIIIHKNGSLKDEYGYNIDIENLPESIKFQRINDPQLVVLFVADRRCKMEIINKILKICRENYSYHVRFMASDQYKIIK